MNGFQSVKTIVAFGLLGVSPLMAQLPQARQYWQDAQLCISKEPKRALGLYQNAYELALKAGERDFAASTCVDMATVHYIQDDYSEALFLCRRGLALGKRARPLNDTTRFQLYASLGEMFHQLTQPDSIRRYWQLADELLETNPKLLRQTPQHVAAYYGNRGSWAVDQGDYGLAESYFRNRLNLSSRLKTIRSQATAENQLANFYLRTARLSEAERLFRASLLHYPMQDIHKGWLLLGVADFYYKLHRSDSAQVLLREAEQIRKKLPEPNPEFDRYIRQGWGQYYLKQGQLPIAIAYLRQTLALNVATNQEGTLPARTWRLLSQIAARRQRWSTAFAHAQYSIQAVGKSFANESSRPSLSGIINGPALVESLRWKADLWNQLALQKNDSQALDRAIHTYQQMFWLTDQLQTTYRAELSKLFFQQEIRPAYRAGLQAIFRRWIRSRDVAYLRLLLQVQEQSKAAILAEQQTIPVSSAHGINLVNQAIDIHRLQTRLDSQSALLHYSVMSEGLLLTVFRAKKVTVIKLPLSINRLNSLVDSLRPMVYHSPDPFQYEGHRIARQLYIGLIKPVLSSLTGVSRLLIVRDGLLHQLPFEVLETAHEPGSYLLRHYAISYDYSARTALGEEQVLPKESPRILSMAPFVPDAATLPVLQRQGYEFLQSSRSEVDAVGGTVSVGESASKQAFLDLIAQHDQFHLATHARASDNPGKSYVSFFPGEVAHRLYAYEIAQLNLRHLRLVMLSACRSGDGRVHDSEGLLSLARAFAQAGSRSVLTSLWEANDLSTTKLTTLFYEHLREGKPTDVSLQQAKLAFIQQEGANGGFAPPFYWAHLILMGQNGPTYPPANLQERAVWSGYVALGLGLLMIVVAIGWVSKRAFANRFGTLSASDRRFGSGRPVRR
ncbi:CHAT domain-containing protein [Spirosoma litoris]